MGGDMKRLILALPLLLAACGKDEAKPGGMGGGQGAASADRAQDPVCQMWIDRAGAKKMTHEGATYYFCADDCVAKFKADPKKYAAHSCLCAKSSKKCACEHCGGDSPCDCAK